MTRPLKHCALYTRKSSEEGLDQAFNSLDAQREACAAYVKSQAGEGWRALATHYGDGGISGGTMERPALQRLLSDIEAGRVDVVVVYKIDRLTRSLADFARMVELFERHQVSFVSVTQSFNTTSSMGRLTLNVLLSFAQFEREVTGERIRDKIAASKKKGMWMGGRVPLGYDPPSANAIRALVVNEAEAGIVRGIFRSYLELGSVPEVLKRLDREGIRSKVHRTASGTVSGGQTFSRGALFHLLKNRTYLGEIVHGSEVHPGLHEPIIDLGLFEAVQAKLQANTRRGAGSGGSVAPCMLTGRIFDHGGRPLTPSFAYGRKKKLYRYYVTARSACSGDEGAGDQTPTRIPASAIEARVEQVIARVAGNLADGSGLAALERLEVHGDRLRLFLSPASSIDAVNLADGERLIPDAPNASRAVIEVPAQIRTRGGRSSVAGGEVATKPDPVLINALRCAHAMIGKDHAGMPVLEAAPDTPYRRKLVRLAFLAPPIQSAILNGRQLAGLTLTRLMDSPIPAAWDEQIALFTGASI
ncbi:recombinase family protein [Tepidamorphus sp. 3E244]|uniref:recombinase family protein n=1 Tax=Tepidamorphus sp. 3E244 TaxID=3385498 RepID=UPI0038FC8EF7